MKIGKLKTQRNNNNNNNKKHTFADTLTVALWDPKQRIQQSHVCTPDSQKL